MQLHNGGATTPIVKNESTMRSNIEGIKRRNDKNASSNSSSEELGPVSLKKATDSSVQESTKLFGENRMEKKERQKKKKPVRKETK